MPRPAGRGLGRVVPLDWNASNRPVADGMLTDECTITRDVTPGLGSTLDRDTGAVTGPTRTVLGTDVPCRVEVHQDQGPSEVSAGEQQVTTRAFKIQVPWDFVAVAVNDLVEVTDSQDPALIGRTFRVLSVAATTLQWSRVLRCEADEG